MILKFRQLNKKNSTFHYWGLVAGKWVNPKTLDNYIKPEDSDQFTNAKDKNGQEVYQNDIIEFDRREWGGDDNIFSVEWNDYDKSWCFGGGCQSEMHFRKVIGNTHHNPRILDQISTN